MNKKEISTIRLQSGEIFYARSAAIQLAEITIDFLQECETEGLIQFQEVEGTVGYSAGDVRRLARIRRLRQDLELDLPAVEVVLHLRQQVSRLLNDMDQLEQRLVQREQELLREVQELRRRLAIESGWE
jgi:DNA-binding transcriptional MerR regulator